MGSSDHRDKPSGSGSAELVRYLVDIMRYTNNNQSEVMNVCSDFLKYLGVT
jgi:hypothetical protein